MSELKPNRYYILEDDLKDDPAVPEFLERKGSDRDGPWNLASKTGKAWFGQCYRSAREILYEQDVSMRLRCLAEALIGVSLVLPEDFVTECVSIAVQEKIEGKDGIPAPPVDDEEYLKMRRERYAEKRRDNMKSVK
jgi:hypothetical protein